MAKNSPTNVTRRSAASRPDASRKRPFPALSDGGEPRGSPTAHRRDQRVWRLGGAQRDGGDRDRARRQPLVHRAEPGYQPRSGGSPHRGRSRGSPLGSPGRGPDRESPTGPDDALWFTEFGGTSTSLLGCRAIGRIDPRPGRSPNSRPASRRTAGRAEIMLGSDGELWFTENDGNQIGRIDPITKQITEFR